MARIDEAPEERDTQPLEISRMVDCEECGTVFDHIFVCPPGVYEVEDLTDAPVDEVKCPNPDCGVTFEAEAGIWTAHADAG